MKKLLLVFLCYCCMHLAAQDKRANNDSVCRLVQRYFNAKNADSLYALTGTGFRATFTKEMFIAVSQNNLFPLGTMQAQFESYTNGISKYKSVFANAIIGLYISLDTADKLKEFALKPYVNETRKAVKPATNNLLQTLLDKAVDSIVQPYISLAATHGLSIGILQHDSMYFYGYGEVAAGSKQIPDKHTLFEIGSVTKTFTAILLADAVNTGKLRLTDPINKYLPDSIPALQWKGIPVTIQMLSNHSSGLDRMPANFDEIAADGADPYKNYTNQQLFHFYKTYKPGRKPGSKYEYSNMAVATLGIILERIYKKSFEQLVAEKICTPLQMNDTRQFIPKNDSMRVAKGYDEEGKYNGPWNFAAFAAAGALRSTAADMLKYANANLGKAPAPLNNAIQLSQVVTFSDGKNKVALGWHYIRPGTDEILWHNGGTGGFVSYLGIHLNKKFAVVVLSNTAISVDKQGNELVKYLEKSDQ